MANMTAYSGRYTDEIRKAIEGKEAVNVFVYQPTGNGPFILVDQHGRHIPCRGLKIEQSVDDATYITATFVAQMWE